ncbi:MAG: ABC transporter permease [Actinomycetota bacterium]|nr:ABC transporter permease [Actinomycetota bacterium]
MSTAPVERPPRQEPPAEEALHAALASGARPPRPSALSTTLTFAWRNMLKIKHVPEQLLDVTITPVLFLMMFTYLFGGAVAGSTSDYLQYILPGILVQSVLFTTVYSGVTLNTDVTKGVVDRFRSLPIWRPAPLFGAMLGDVCRFLFAGIVTVVFGMLLGFDPEGGVLGVIGALLLVVTFAFGLAWVFTTVGALLRAQNAVMNAGFMALFPLIFLSNIFVDPDTLPRGLRAFVDVNPISHLVTATRDAMAGEFDAGNVGIVLGVTVLLTAVFAPLTVRLYRSRD